MKQLLLHCCCAPCATRPLTLLASAGYELSLWYYNPNIHPLDEFKRRGDCLSELAKGHNLPLQVPEYDPLIWQQAIAGHEGVWPLVETDESYELNLDKRSRRCRLCYRLRFEALAEAAAEQNIPCIGTSLSISPWQFTDIIREELDRAARLTRREACFVDFRAEYAASRIEARQAGFYLQNYCGCRYSLNEALAERKARRAAKHSSAAEHNPEHDSERDSGRSAERNPECGTPRNPERGTPRNPECGTPRNPERDPERNPERDPGRSAERNPEHDSERDPGRSAERNPERGKPRQTQNEV